MSGLSLLAYAGGYALLNVVGAAIVKTEIATGLHAFDSSGSYIDFLLEARVIAGLGVVFLGALVLFRALSLFELSRVIPVSIGVNFVLSAVVGRWLFGESASAAKLLGLVLMLAGALLASAGER